MSWALIFCTPLRRWFSGVGAVFFQRGRSWGGPSLTGCTGVASTAERLFIARSSTNNRWRSFLGRVSHHSWLSWGFGSQRCAEQVIHQRQEQATEAAPCISSRRWRRACNRCIWRIHGRRANGCSIQVLTGVKHFVKQITEDHAASKQSGDIGACTVEQPPGGQGDRQAV